MCECCLENGDYTPAEHVHHIVWLNSSNASNPEYTLNFSNLKAVCHTCHNKIHAGTEHQRRRYKVGADGSIEIKEDIPPSNK